MPQRTPPEDIAAFLKPFVELAPANPSASLKENIRGNLQLMQQMVESPAFHGEREYFRTRIAELLAQTDAVGTDETDLFNATSTMNMQMERGYPRGCEEWRGIKHLWQEYAAAPATPENTRRKARLLWSATRNTAVTDGDRDGPHMYIGLQQRQRLQNITEQDMGMPVDIIAIRTRLDAIEKTCSDPTVIAADDLAAIDRELADIFEKLQPMAGMI